MAATLFEEELAAFRNICEVNTICMHGNVLSRYDNRDLWQNIEIENYNVLGEASLSIENAQEKGQNIKLISFVSLIR